jgi:hypothetical protein
MSHRTDRRTAIQAFGVGLAAGAASCRPKQMRRRARAISFFRAGPRRWQILVPVDFAGPHDCK